MTTTSQPEATMNRTSDTATIHVVIATTRNNDPEVHEPGCADVKRGMRSGKYERTIDLLVDKIEDAGDWFWDDFIAEESMTVEDAQTYTKYLPCTRQLAAKPEPVAAPEPTEPKPVFGHCVSCGWVFAGPNRVDHCGSPAACAKRQADPERQADKRVAQDAR